jgi:hypothetical protein
MILTGLPDMEDSAIMLQITFRIRVIKVDMGESIVMTSAGINALRRCYLLIKCGKYILFLYEMCEDLRVLALHLLLEGLNRNSKWRSLLVLDLSHYLGNLNLISFVIELLSKY